MDRILENAPSLVLERFRAFKLKEEKHHLIQVF
jgi:hypothetical protein